MTPDCVLAPAELARFGVRADAALDLCLQAFMQHQQQSWPLLDEAWQTLQQTRHRHIALDHTTIQLQCNPGRMRSATARVDRQSVADRPCFLCPHALYPRQRALTFARDWLVLCNPFPIVPGHLVITHRQHRPQRLADTTAAMQAFSRATRGRYAALYNGPACGASAPDHLHFQACPAEQLPLLGELASLPWHPLGPACALATAAGRTIVRVTTPAAEDLPTALRLAVVWLPCTATEAEPMVNVAIIADVDKSLALLFPRQAHRPACYALDGPQRVVVSPGVIDLGGVLVTPRLQDFEKIDGAAVRQIFSEVCLPDATIRAALS